MRTRSSRNRGAILIIVLGVLAVLALLGTTFATLQNTERHIARNYEDTVHAKMWRCPASRTPSPA
jgi:Tfp pilus assembly protein PilX